MKKIISLLIIMVFFIPSVVKADMGAPVIEPYKLIVTAPEGIDYYYRTGGTDTKKHLNYNDIFEVEYEYKDNGSYVYSIIVEKDVYDTYITSLDGTALVTKELDPTDAKLQMSEKKSGQALVYAKDGVDLLKGPSSAYDKITHIKKGTKLNYTYITGESDSGISYIYVTYNGKNGWLSILNGEVLLKESNIYIFRKDFKTTSCGTIPKNTILKSLYKTDQWSGEELFKYNDCEDLVPVFRSLDVLLIDEEAYAATSKKEFKVYEYAENEGSIVTTIPKDKKFIQYASTFSYGEDDEDLYVEYEGKRGWIKTNINNFETDIDSKVKFTYEFEEEKEEEPLSSEEDKKKEDNDEEVKKSSKKSIDDYVITYCIIGIAVSLSTIIIIILINKKRKNKIEKLKEDSSDNIEENKE